MSESLVIKAEVKYDAERPYVGDPVGVMVSLETPSGNDLTGTIKASLVTPDGTIEDQQTTSSGSELSLVASSEGMKEVWVSAVSEDREGESIVDWFRVGEVPQGVSVSTSGQQMVRLIQPF